VKDIIKKALLDNIERIKLNDHGRFYSIGDKIKDIDKHISDLLEEKSRLLEIVEQDKKKIEELENALRWIHENLD
jgi:predicted nuclease with TOPRIM domain